jgi:hypothetical protein
LPQPIGPSTIRRHGALLWRWTACWSELGVNPLKSSPKSAGRMRPRLQPIFRRAAMAASRLSSTASP